MARKVNVNIEINGKNISPIAHLAIHQPLNGHHTFELRCPIQEKEKVLSDSSDACGKEIKIDISSGSGKSNAKNFFKGYVTGISLSKHQGAANEIIYYGHAPTLLMDDGAHNQSFSEKTLDKIVKEVTGKYGVSLKVSPAFKGQIPYVVQYHESSFHFLSRMANQYGEWFFYDGTDLYFGKAPSPSPVDLVFGRDLFSFDLALNIVPTKFKWMAYDEVSHKFPESTSASVKVAGLDDYGKKISSASDSLFSNEPAVAVYAEVQDKAELDELTKHQRAARSGNFVIFNGSSDNHALKVGSIINVKGKIGDAANSAGKEVGYGEFRVIKISHSTDALGNYQNHFKAIPSSLTEPPVNTTVGNPECEMQPAEVLENHDPEELGRVRVQFQWQKSTGDKTPWIRVAASGAGGGYGYFFVPEKNDQVLVGFEYGNPDKPYVMGGLYHGKAKPKGVSDKDNNNKVIQTKSGNKISLVDKPGNEEIKIENGHNVITLNLKAPGTITIKTDGDLSLSAKNITIAADQKLTMSSMEASLEGTQKVNIKGMETTVEADVKNVVKGTMVEVSASAIVDIKGAMVKLNS